MENQISQMELLLAKGNLSVEQPEILSSNNELDVLNISNLNIELAKLGLQKVNVNASKNVVELAWAKVRECYNEIAKEKEEKVTTLLDVVQPLHQKRFKDSFLSKMFELGKYNLIEKYFTEKELSTKEYLEYFKGNIFKVQGVCDLTSDVLKNALKSNQSYYRLDSSFLHFFTNEREYRIKLSQFDLLKYKTDNSLLEAKGANVINVKLPFAKSELNKAQKAWAEKKATEIATKGEAKISEYITDVNKRTKVVRELKKY